jgi:hypothetical protein
MNKSTNSSPSVMIPSLIGYKIFKTIRKKYKYQGRRLRIIVFLAVPSPYTAVYGEIRHENGPYFVVFLMARIRHRIQYRICVEYRRMHAVFSLQTVVKHRPGLQ